jgi:hypothetical protein
MRDLPIPRHNVNYVITQCNRRVRAPLRHQFNLSRARFVEIERDYIAAGSSGRLGSLTFDYDSIAPTKQSMADLYNNRIVPEASSGRHIYDEIRTKDGGQCALCALREAGTVDHYLPKEAYPALAFVPANLLPACSLCNGRKGQYEAATRDTELLHPYFDTMHSVQWVSADIPVGNPVPSYRINRHSSDLQLSNRVAHHFDKFRLADSYGIYAANELAILRGILSRLFDPPEERWEEIKSYLEIAANASFHASSRNDWRAVAYKSWSRSDWFIRGGFLYSSLDAASAE